MSLVSTIAGSLIGGALDKKTADSTNRANLLANQQNINAAAANQDKAMSSLASSTPDTSTTKNPDGSFKTDFVRGSGSDLLNRGDVGRAGTVNNLSSNFNLKLPTVGAARNIIDEGNNVRQAQFDNGAADIAKLNQRQYGGMNNSGQAPAALRAMGEFANANRFNAGQEALALYDKSASNDYGNLTAAIAANSRQAPQVTGVGNTGAQIVAQTPPGKAISDLSGASTSAAGSNIIAQIQQQIASEEANAFTEKLIRSLGNQGTFSGGS
jgi:hypothetical protein